MKKVFILRSIQPWAVILIALSFLLSTVNGYFTTEPTTLQYWGTIVSATAFVITAFYFVFVLTNLVGTAPKVVVSNDTLLLKGSFLGSGKEIEWSEIKSISFHAFQVDLKLETEPIFFSYRSSAKVSKELKDAIRDMAELQGIAASGG